MRAAALRCRVNSPAGVLAAVFCHMQQHRSLLVEEVVEKVMPHVHVHAPKPAPRAAVAVPDACPELHVVTRTFLQMMQVRWNMLWSRKWGICGAMREYDCA